MTLEQINQILAFVVFSYSDVHITVAKIIKVPLILFAIWFVVTRIGKLIKRTLLAKKLIQDAVHLFTRIYFIISIAILVFTSLEVLSIPVTAFAFVSGAIAIGVGFGAQNIINNFISGWILMWERPIRIGDFLEIEDTKGVVEEINTRSTRIKRVDGVHLLIPNSKLLENTVVNWTLVDRLVRTSVKVGVAYGSPAKKVADLILQATEEESAVLKDPKPLVTFEDFGDNSLMFETTYWIHSNVEGGLRITRSNIRFRLDELFEENNIVVAFPQRDVHLDGSITLINNANQ